MDTPYVSIPEAAKLLGISAYECRARLEAGLIPGGKVGNKWVLHRAEILRYRQFGREPNANGHSGLDVDSLRVLLSAYRVNVSIEPRR